MTAMLLLDEGALNLRSRQKESERKEGGGKSHAVDGRCCWNGIRSLLNNLLGLFKRKCCINERNGRDVRRPTSERRGLLVARVKDASASKEMSTWGL